MRKFIFHFASLVAIFVTVVASLYVPHANAAFNSNLIMDDVVFNDTSSMSAAAIDNWLNVNWPSSCISSNNGFAAPDPTGYSPSNGFTYGGDVTAGRVIYDAANAYGLNPQVLIATIQKEEGLVSGGGAYGCSALAISAAVGYGCPDGGSSYSYSGIELYSIHGTPVTSVSGTCVNSSAKIGFSRQLIHAAWLFKFAQQRSLGNTGWNVQLTNSPQPGDSWDNSDDPSSPYGGPMTQGNLSRGDGSPVTYYDGYTTIDNTAVHMDSGATAALYWYTPHFHGNQMFYDNFTAWFGGTISASYYSCHDATNVSGAITGEHVIGSKLGINHTDNMRLIIPNNTGSSCVEVHTWQNNNYQSWIQHIATNSPAVDPATEQVISADGNGDGVDELYKIDYSGTASGMIEIHVWDNVGQRWLAHIATNRPCISKSDAEVVMADTDGDGRASTFLVQYRNTSSGRIEVHQWSPNLQQWVSHIATNYGAVDPASAQVISADLDATGHDSFYLVNYSGNSGRIEVHQWSPNFQQWLKHIATNSPSATHVDASGNPVSDVIAADTNGNAQDELYKVDYTGTASGKVEIHGWTQNLQQWASHTATSQGAF